MAAVVRVPPDITELGWIYASRDLLLSYVLRDDEHVVHATRSSVLLEPLLGLFDANYFAGILADELTLLNELRREQTKTYLITFSF